MPITENGSVANGDIGDGDGDRDGDREDGVGGTEMNYVIVVLDGDGFTLVGNRIARGDGLSAYGQSRALLQPG